jgi:K319-like protein
MRLRLTTFILAVLIGALLPGCSDDTVACGDCNDNVACTVDSCDADGNCVNEPDDNLCGNNEVCHDTQGCVQLLPCQQDTECDDTNPCTDDVCDPVDSICRYTNNTAACDDDDACTNSDICGDGSCAGTPINCDDANACTDDACDPVSGNCQNTIDTTNECDDGLECTVNDACLGSGACAGEWDTVNCGCDSDDDCSVLTNACNTGRCETATGACFSEVQVGQGCSDGDACSESDVCQADGSCVGSSKDCSDGNSCTDDSCDPANGNCLNDIDISNTCDDSDPCTTTDSCQADGSCAGSPKDCSDGDDCTDDSCEPASGNCLNEIDISNTCDDGDPCTTSDACLVDGSCLGTQKDCSDSNDCTDDSCDSASGNCLNDIDVTNSCDDGDACTLSDACQVDGSCAGSQKDCSDGNDCTDDLCDSLTGDCSNPIDVSNACDDDEVCTINDACLVDGSCAGEWDVANCGCTENSHCSSLDDDCNLGRCDTDSNSCYAEPQVDQVCSDGNDCTINDLCQADGSCDGTPVSCSASYPCPDADAGNDLMVDAGQPFSLDGSSTTNPQNVTLLWSWTGEAGAPALTGADTSTPSGTATVCGSFVYTLEVTEPCGLSDTDTVVLTVAANGPYVSNTTCDSALECGTVDYPWCTIQSGINNTATSPVMVAGVAGLPYIESPIMADGIDVLGGYEPTFSAGRNADPFTNDTLIELASEFGLQWPPGAAALIDGFTLTLVDGTGADRFACFGDGSTDMALANILTNSSMSGAVTGVAYGVIQTPGSGGSLSISGSFINTGDADNISAAVVTVGSGPVTISDSSLTAADGAFSIGLFDVGQGWFEVSGGDITAGTGSILSSGIRADLSTGPNPGGRLAGVIITGGLAPSAYGVNFINTGACEIDGCTITGGGEATDSANEAIGVLTQAVGRVIITASPITGATPPVDGPMGLGVGVQLNGSADGLATVAIIDGSDISGGDVAEMRQGIHSDSVPLTLTTSNVAGSLTFGSVNAVGVLIDGFIPGASHLLNNNVSIEGGPAASSNTAPYQAFGVVVSTVNSVTISDNGPIQGCSPHCMGPGFDDNNPAFGVGIMVRMGAGHVIDINESILGGPHVGAPEFTTHVGVMAGFADSSGIATLVEPTIENNTLIAGNLDPDQRPTSSVGVFSRDVRMLAIGNTQILGGYALDNATGIAVLPRLVGINYVDIVDNSIGGGAAMSTTGAAIAGSELFLLSNVIDGCGLAGSDPGQPPADCLPTLMSNGLVSGCTSAFTGCNPFALHSNNFIFGGFGGQSIACSIGGPPDANSMALTVYNLCLAQGKSSGPGGFTAAIGLQLGAHAGPPPAYDFRNNILSAGDQALMRYGAQETAGLVSVTFRANDFIPDSIDDPFVTYYMHTTLGELDDVTDINALMSPPLDYAFNIATNPLFLSPNPNAPSATDYHLNPNCVLSNLGEVSIWETFDYDGELRGTGTNPSDYPEIGPDECE